MNRPQAPAGSLWLIALAFVVVMALGTWAAVSELDQIAHAQGQVIASSRTQVIQSANDGVIESLLVSEGETVQKGQVLARLERNQAEAARADSLGKVAALKAALIRLQAEVFNRPLAFTDDVKTYPAFVKNQAELFQRRQAAIRAEVAALEESLALAGDELTLSEKLLATGDVGQSEVIRLRRQVADIKGQITNRRNKYFQDAQADMTKAEEDLATQQQVLAERLTVYERTEITAPADGMVNTIHLTTPGAKVRPGDVIMELLPTGSGLVVEAKLKPADIGYLRKNQAAAVKLDAFDYSVYGVLKGQVIHISPDALIEKTPHGEQAHYRIQVQIDQAALAERNRQRPGKPVHVQPGMTATVDITTGSQSVLAYLTKPITKTIAESLTER